MDDPNPNSLNSFFRSYASDRFAWESDRHCSHAATLWTTFGLGYDTAKKDCANAPSKHVLSDSGSLNSGDMSISTDSSSEFMSCFSGHCADSCTSLSSSSSAAKIPLSVVGWLGLHDARSISTPDAVRSPERLEAEACFLIYAWTLSLFVDVARSALEPAPVVPAPSPSPSTPDSPAVARDALWTPGSPDRGTLIVTTKTPLFGLSEPSAPPAVKFTSHRTTAARACGSITGNSAFVGMRDAPDYEALSPEQAATARNVCMWGRRQERIPKVRVPGQAAAVYCFDARKLRQNPAVRRPLAMATTRGARVGPFTVAKNTSCDERVGAWRLRPTDASSECKPTASHKASESTARVPFSPRPNAYGGSNIPPLRKICKALKAPIQPGEETLRHPAGLENIEVYRS